MRENLRFIVTNLICFVLSGLVCFAILGCIYLDLTIYKGVLERRFVECTQEVLLLMSTLIFLYLALRKKYSGLWLVGGFIGCMFIRELDCVFDKVFHGAWLYVALLVASLCVYKAWCAGIEKTVYTLADFMKNKAFAKMSCGLLIVLVYSRLIGYKPLWHLVMKKHYLRSVKTIVEEGTELFGYSIIFLATVEYASYLLSQKKDTN